MKKYIFHILLLTCLATHQTVQAQVDPHFSQYYVYPSWLNPALTGVFDGDYRISGIYRNQWNSVASPFSTIGLSADMNTSKNLNFGLSVLNQKAGDAGYNYLTAYGSIAYTGVKFGATGTHQLVFGIQGGVVNRRISSSKFKFGEQWNPVTGYNPDAPISDILTTPSSTVFDAGAGILYFDAAQGKKANLYAGFSASHLTQPTDPYSNGGKEKLPIRYTAHAGVKWNLSESFVLTPNVLYLRQGNAQEKMVGAYGTLKANTNTDFLLGVNYRIDDAVAPFAGFTYKNLVLGLSYDVNTSDLGSAVKGTNSFELSLSYISRKSYKPEKGYFVCPRL